ncbi:SPOR domain-containing protein [Propionivibrio limicola]|uniref:SPOR domain-containing protein n=1 Tax=Propionivibrio limicola TaxID=167645 RepID=UPI0012915AF3|nr:SPOR domain-containing protein [Propionivibrio limicola]
MSRDLKHHRRPAAAPKKKSGGGTLVGLFVGLVLGVVCAAGVVWYIQKAPMPFTTNGHAIPSTPAGQAPLALPGKPGDPVPKEDDKPRFDFYKILPGDADAIPDPSSGEQGKSIEPKASEQSNAKDEKSEKDAKKDSALKEPVFLQAGSFQSAADADNQKARLALMGVEASVQQVMLQDKVWYRVRLGPFKKLDEVNNLRSDLAKQGVEANIVKKD